MKTLALKYIALVLLLLLGLGATRLSAQLNFYNPRAYTTNDGLSQSSVYDIMQSKQGYMWFTTGDGVCRFDGREWKTFKTTFEYKKRFAGNHFNSNLFEDKQGTIWVGNAMGLFNRKPGSAQLSFFSPNADTAAYYGINTMVVGINNGTTVWFANANGSLVSYNIDTKQSAIYSYRKYQYAKSPSLSSVYMYNGKIYLGIYNQIIVFDMQAKIFTCIVFNTNGFAQPKHIIAVKNKIYFICASGMYSIVNNSAFKLPLGINEELSRIYLLRNSNVIITTKSGVFYVADTDFNNVYASPMLSGIKNIVAYNCFYLDRNSNVWIGTEGSGVVKADCRRRAFNLLNKGNSPLSSNFIKGVLKLSPDTILIGTSDKGLNVYNRRTGQNTILFNNQPICAIYKDTKGRVWVNAGDDVYMSANSNLVFNKVPYNSKLNFDKGFNYKFQIAQSPNGTVYFASPYPLHYYNEGDKTIRYIDTHSYNLCMYFINDSTLLLPQYDGSFTKAVIDKKDTITTLINLPVKARRARYILNGGKNTVWVASENGLVNYNYVTNQYTIYDDKAGLANTYLYTVLPDAKGNLWVSTNGGISVFNINTKTFRNFDVSYNLQANEFNTGSYYRAADGELFFGGINGLNYFYPDSVSLDTVQPLQAITGIKIYEQNINADSLFSISKTLSLNYNQNSIYLQFAAFDFTAPEINRYAYRLDGQDNRWSDIGTSNYIRFSALAPGTYNFWLKSANRDGAWCVPQKMLTIIIRPPFWQTWWFITLVIVVFIGTIAVVVFSVTRARYRRQLAILEKEKELQKIRLQLSQDIHDDIGGNLSMIALMTDKIKDSPHAPKIADLARNAQKGFRELIWSVNPVHDDVETFVYFLRNHANTFFENTAIETTFNLPVQFPKTTLLPNVRRNLFLTFKEALNNILKHSGATQVVVTVEIVDNQTIYITVQDNGKGLGPAIIKGNGLDNFAHRMQAIGGNFQLTDNAPNGLILKFSAPIG